MPRKKNRRNKQKYPALNPAYNLRSRIDLLECDYLHLLSEDDKEWLNNFNEEDINANFQHEGKKIYKKKKDRKASYDRNNARNRDILTRAKASGAFEPITETMTYNPEDEIIAKIDLSRKRLKK